mmetsp:Transcript_73969/g.211225  ORF Transcript_73969/g.211225 Transcript_73969/m.211225 type:complete len:210 (-) Transcript_73969:101-730(-)
MLRLSMGLLRASTLTKWIGRWRRIATLSEWVVRLGPGLELRLRMPLVLVWPPWEPLELWEPLVKTWRLLVRTGMTMRRKKIWIWKTMTLILLMLSCTLRSTSSWASEARSPSSSVICSGSSPSTAPTSASSPSCPSASVARWWRPRAATSTLPPRSCCRMWSQPTLCRCCARYPLRQLRRTTRCSCPTSAPSRLATLSCHSWFSRGVPS